MVVDTLAGAFDYIHGGAPESEPAPEQVWQNWVEFLARERGVDICAHPALALLRERGAGRPLVYARWQESAGEQARSLRSLAVLAPKTVRLAQLPGVERLTTLRGYRLVGDRLIGPDAPCDAMEFVAAIRRMFAEGRTECVLIEDLEVSSALWTAIEHAGAAREFLVTHPSPPQTHWWIRFPAKRDEYWKGLTSRYQRTLRRELKRLEHTVTCFRAPGDVPEFLGKAQAIAERSWKGRRMGTRIRNDEDTRRRLMRVAAHGALRSYVLEHHGRPIAFLYGHQWSDRYVGEEIGFDTEFAGRAPGKLLIIRMIQDLLAHDCPAVFDFGHGDADYKRRISNHKTLSGPVLMVSRSWRPRTALLVNKVRHLADQAGRSMLRRAGLYDKARYFYRRL